MLSLDNSHVLSGKRFGSMTVIGLARSDNGAVMMCVCDCGNNFERRASEINRGERLGKNQSCGCSYEYREVLLTGTRTCPVCTENKNVNMFSKSTTTSYGLQISCKNCSAAWRSKNRENLDKYIKEYQANNKDRLNKKKKEYRSNRKRQYANYSREWRLRNPDKRKKVAMNYVKNNPEKMAARAAARRAMKLQATPSWANDEKIKNFYIESRERTRVSGIKHHVDHIVPLVSNLVCGLHCEDNLMVIEGKENIRKGNRYWPNMPEKIN